MTAIQQGMAIAEQWLEEVIEDYPYSLEELNFAIEQICDLYEWNAYEFQDRVRESL